MNTAVVLPAILLGRAIDRALALERGQATAGDVAWAALAFIGGTLLTEVPRIAKRWWLMTANARIRANLRADAFRGVLAWPMADLQRMPLGDLMARIVGDVEVLGVGVREFTIEIWDTVLFSLSLRGGDARHRPGPHAAGARARPDRDDPGACHRALGGQTDDERAGSERGSDRGDSGVSGRRAGAAPVRARRCRGGRGWRALSRRFAERNLGAIRLKAGLQPIYTTLMTSGVLLVVWHGSERVIAGTMTVGAFVAYLELFLRFVNRGHRIPQLVNSVQSGAAAYARLRPLLAPALPRAGRAAAGVISCGTSRGWRASGVRRLAGRSGPAAARAARRDLSVPRRRRASALRA